LIVSETLTPVSQIALFMISIFTESVHVFLRVYVCSVIQEIWQTQWEEKRKSL